MSKKKGPSLLSMIERERHNVAASMTNQDPAWTQETTQPNRSVAKMFVIMLGVHILVIAGLIMYDFATGTKKQPVTVQKTLPEPGTDTGLSKPEATPPGGTSVATVDPRNETPAITGEATPAPQPEVAAAPSPAPLPFVNNPSMQPPAAPATSPGGMPALALGTTSRVDLEPVSTSSVPVPLPPAASPSSLSQPSIDLPSPAATESAPAPETASVTKTEPAKPVKTEEKKSIASAPPVTKKTETKKPAPKPAAAPAKVRSGSSHTVSKGDTLGAIAKRYGVSTAALVRANNLKNPDQVVLGTKLVIPKK